MRDPKAFHTSIKHLTRDTVDSIQRRRIHLGEPDPMETLLTATTDGMTSLLSKGMAQPTTISKLTTQRPILIATMITPLKDPDLKTSMPQTMEASSNLPRPKVDSSHLLTTGSRMTIDLLLTEERM